MSKMGSGLWWLVLSLVVIVLDQFSKQLALSVLNPYEPVSVFPFLNIMLAFNPGAAFSFLGDQDGWQRWLFIVLALGVSVMLALWLAQNKASQSRLNAGLSLVLGGAIGNVIDRFMLNHVVDFIDFYVGIWHYPTFNVADISITLGALLLLWDAWQKSKPTTQAP